MKYTLSDFNYHLPKEKIATTPAHPREAAKLLAWPYDGEERTFADLPNMLNSGDLLVLNDTKVIPARLKATRPREQQEGLVEVEILLHKPINGDLQTWEAFAKPAKRCKVGQSFDFGADLAGEIIWRDEDRVGIKFNASPEDIFLKFDRIGEMPLPPYIERPDGASSADAQDYQTEFAKHQGSVAAPTAGLHFSQQLLKQLQDKGVSLEYVTLHVGAGTFQPVRTEDLSAHKMHSEWGRVTAQTAVKINQTKASGGRVAVVGTTSLRILESAAHFSGEKELPAWEGETDIFITPGFKFKVADVLITNFHLPKSTLLMLVSAFIGFDEMKKLYDIAVNGDFKFFSYGDGCFLNRK